MYKNNEYVNLSELIRAIDNLPKTIKAELSTTLDNEENKRGHWIKKEDDDNWWFECSRCAYEPQNEHVPTAFCCNCGVEMDEYTDLVQSCETCKFFDNKTLWCSQYNDTTYHSNCSSYKAIE